MRRAVQGGAAFVVGDVGVDAQSQAHLDRFGVSASDHSYVTPSTHPIPEATAKGVTLCAVKM